MGRNKVIKKAMPLWKIALLLLCMPGWAFASQAPNDDFDRQFERLGQRGRQDRASFHAHWSGEAPYASEILHGPLIKTSLRENRLLETAQRCSQMDSSFRERSRANRADLANQDGFGSLSWAQSAARVQERQLEAEAKREAEARREALERSAPRQGVCVQNEPVGSSEPPRSRSGSGSGSRYSYSREQLLAPEQSRYADPADGGFGDLSRMPTREKDEKRSFAPNAKPLSAKPSLSSPEVARGDDAFSQNSKLKPVARTRLAERAQDRRQQREERQHRLKDRGHHERVASAHEFNDREGDSTEIEMPPMAIFGEAPKVSQDIGDVEAEKQEEEDGSHFCFIAGTLVLTAEGCRAIEELSAGDEVFSCDHSQGLCQLQVVEQVLSSQAQSLLSIRVEAEDGTVHTLQATPEHPFFSLKRQAYVAAADLDGVESSQDPDLLLTASGQMGRVLEVHNVGMAEPVTVFNLVVSGHHNYYVGAPAGTTCTLEKYFDESSGRFYLVHNCSYLSTGLDFVPVVGEVKSLAEATAGIDLITGESLTWAERGVALAAVFPGPLSKAGKVGAKGGKAAAKLMARSSRGAVGAEASTATRMLARSHAGQREAVAVGHVSSNSGLKFESNPKHGKYKVGKANSAPTNPRYALDNSIELPGNTKRRIGVDKANNEFTVFDEHTPGKFHGHSRSWAELDQQMRNVLLKEQLVTKKGKIK